MVQPCGDPRGCGLLGRQMLDIPAKELLGLAVLGAIVSTIGTLAGLILKEFFAARMFEQWKARVAAEGVFRRYRDPLSLASFELVNRLIEIIEKERPNFLRPEVLAIDQVRIEKNSDEDLYFQKYKYESTIFRLASVLGWTELFRQDVTFLDSGHTGTNDALTACMREMRAALAEGHLSQELLPDWKDWRDHLIFREEQRAIGESMINSEAEPRRISGYAQYLSRYAENNAQWHTCVAGFFENLGEADKDFRVYRCKLLAIALGKLLVLTNSRLITDRIHEAVTKYSKDSGSLQLSTPRVVPLPSYLVRFAHSLSS